MTRTYWKIAGGRVYDPIHNLDGVIKDLWISDGKIVEPPQDPQVRPTRTLDADGLVVMPGGIDMHCHIAGPKVNTARKMRPEEKRNDPPLRRTDRTRSGTLGSVPSSFATGYKYAGLGYTTAMDAAVSPLAARAVHQELQDTPCLDTGFYVLMGNNHYLMNCIRQQDESRLESAIAWILDAAKGFAPKLVNPGGVEMWKQSPRGNVTDMDQPVDGFQVTPRQIVRGVSAAAHSLGLPHPVHIHCNNLGLPGNSQTTLETMQSLEGFQGHLTHIQFHSYGGEATDEHSLCSSVQPLAEYVNQHPNVTVDVGQVLFGSTTSMTGDGPLGHFLHQIYGDKWYSCDTELESGCGISPIKYRNRSLVHTMQWAIGLEWYLLVQDPWRVVMSTDHPNGGSFLAYPQIIRLLMDRTFRQDVIKTVHPDFRKRSILGELDREYTLSEICIITRAGPAKILGLSHKGHLGPGADADITVYTPDTNWQRMFELPRYVIKSGEIIVEHAEIRQPAMGKTLYVAVDYDRDLERDLADWFEENYSVRFRNYPMTPQQIVNGQAVACR